MTAPYYDMIEEVRVILVDNDKAFVDETIDLLESYKYKVMTVDTALTAKSMLSKGKEKIDVMIINVHSPDLLSFSLLAQAVALDIVSLAICDEDNEFLATRALNLGAYLYLKKPFDEKIVKYLWQFVLMEKIRKKKAREGLKENKDHINVGDADDIGNNYIVGDEEQAGEKNILYTKERSNNIEAKYDVVSNEKYKLKRKRGRKSTKEITEGESQSSAINKIVMQKVYMEWTVDLHVKFTEVVQQLGEGRCFPKEILEAMNVPGLTRMQVASHLQKCRNNNWKAPQERKFIRHSLGQKSSSDSQQKNRIRKFEIMPRLQTNVTNLQQQRCNPAIQSVPKFLFPSQNMNNIFSRGESSIQQQVYRQQLDVGPNYLSTDNPFNDSFLSDQNNIDAGLQQQHSPLFGMLGLQGLQGPIYGSTNYRFELASNSGGYHDQNDYQLNANVENVTTCSSNTMIYDTDVENMTIINGLGAANDNFQKYMDEQNMFNPGDIVVTSDSDTKGSDSNKKKNYDAYFDFNNMDYLFQNLGPPSDDLPNKQDNKFDQVYSGDQVATTPSVKFLGITNFSDKSST